MAGQAKVCSPDGTNPRSCRFWCVAPLLPSWVCQQPDRVQPVDGRTSFAGYRICFPGPLAAAAGSHGRTGGGADRVMRSCLDADMRQRAGGFASAGGSDPPACAGPALCGLPAVVGVGQKGQAGCIQGSPVAMSSVVWSTITACTCLLSDVGQSLPAVLCRKHNSKVRDGGRGAALRHASLAAVAGLVAG